MTKPLPPVISVDDAQKRLLMVFPAGAFDTATHNPLAAQAVAAMIYMGAVLPDEQTVTKNDRIVRPTSCLWLQEEVLSTHTAEAERVEFHRAAAASSNPKIKARELVAKWGITFDQPYADGTREPLRDETFDEWLSRGAIKSLPDVQTNYPNARWALAEDFASLFDPRLTGHALAVAVEKWRSEHLSPTDLARVIARKQREQRPHRVRVVLPDGSTRDLEPGTASLIIKGVLEVWMPMRLTEPMLVAVSEPREPVFLADEALLAAIGVHIDSRSLLPDVVVIDVGVKPAEVWIIEAVHSDGAITEGRRAELVAWARDQRLDESALRFLSAFTSRTDPAVRKRIKDLAVGSLAWFLDEPTRELAWYEIVPAT